MFFLHLWCEEQFLTAVMKQVLLTVKIWWIFLPLLSCSSQRRSRMRTLVYGISYLSVVSGKHNQVFLQIAEIDSNSGRLRIQLKIKKIIIIHCKKGFTEKSALAWAFSQKIIKLFSLELNSELSSAYINPA